MRIAVIQHGDFAEAKRLLGSGTPEPYSGMRASVDALDRLFADDPYLVISIGAPAYEEVHGKGTWVGLPPPNLPAVFPDTLGAALWASRIRRRANAFRPTHLLLRVSGLIGWRLLEYSARRGLDTVAIFASSFIATRRYDRFINRKLVELLNGDNVQLVGNHRAPAAASLIAAGVRSEKVIAYDYGVARRPDDFPLKELPAADRSSPVPRRIVVVGNMLESKGIGDLIDAVAILHREGRRVELVAAGDGPEFDRIKARAALLPPDAVSFLGRVSNEQTFDLMRGSALVVIPTRPEFPEGMPQTLTEALASRTPVIVSDHPVMASIFREGEGVRFFKAADPADLARAIRVVLDDAAGYRALSESTGRAFDRVDCKTLLGDLLERWRRMFEHGVEHRVEHRVEHAVERGGPP